MRDRIYLQPNLSFSVTLQNFSFFLLCWRLHDADGVLFLPFVLKILTTPSWRSQKTRRWEIQVAVSLWSFTYTHVWMGAMNHTCESWSSYYVGSTLWYFILFIYFFGRANYQRIFVTFIYSKKLHIIMSWNLSEICVDELVTSWNFNTNGGLDYFILI